MAHRLKMRRKQSSFNAQNIPILGAGADGAAGAVFRDTHNMVHLTAGVRLGPEC